MHTPQPAHRSFALFPHGTCADQHGPPVVPLGPWGVAHGELETSGPVSPPLEMNEHLPDMFGQ